MRLERIVAGEFAPAEITVTGYNSLNLDGAIGFFPLSSPLIFNDGEKLAVHQNSGCCCAGCMEHDGKQFQPGGGATYADTVPGGITTTATLTPGSYLAGEIEATDSNGNSPDTDWFGISLVAGQTYTFYTIVSGSGLDSVLTLYNASGVQIATNDDVNTAAQQYWSEITYTATSSGTYYLGVAGYGNDTGGYYVTSSAPVADSIPANTSTTSTISLGSTVAGNLQSAGDHDWYGVTVVAGTTYSFVTSAVGASDVDTTLVLRDSSGTVLAYNDDSAGTYSRIVFTATTSGTLYLDVAGWGNYQSGTYQVTMSEPPPLTVWTLDQVANQLENGYWGGAGQSRNFNVAPGGAITVNLTALTAAGQALARNALDTWADVTGITFSEVSSGGQITFDDAQDGAFATSTRSGGFITSSQVNVSVNWITTYGSGLNTYSLQTYIHEIGHALGLGHAGNYNGTVSIPADLLYLNDSWPVTVMSYVDQNESPYFDPLGYSRVFITTPMGADIVAVQSMYGVSANTRTGDTTYGFGNTSGRSAFDAVAGVAPAAYAIVDNGGIDTLDYSGYSQVQNINLTAESFSNVGGNIGNVTIGRGTVIENLIGGSGSDVLTGNSANNTIEGRNGNDIINGGAGADVLNGGDGSDTATYADSATGVTADMLGIYAGVGDAAGDSFITIENLTGTAFADTLLGDGGANIISGGVGGDNLYGRGSSDTLLGGDGNDNLEGGLGGDLLDGGVGFDLAYYSAAAASVLIDLANTALNTGEAAGDSYISIDGLVGTGFDDELYGDALTNMLIGQNGDDNLEGRAGDDTLFGGAGDDMLRGGVGADYQDGGDGVDTADFSDALAGIRADLSGTVSGLGDASGDSFVAVEDLIGTGFADTLFGDGGANTISGGFGADNLYGRAGNDTLLGSDGNDNLEGGLGGDVLDGGAGFDLAYYSAAAPVLIDMANAALNTGEAAGDSFISIDGLVATGFDDQLYGDALGNLLIGNGGNDILAGRAGNDILYGGVGDDVLRGGAGSDYHNGGDGTDIADYSDILNGIRADLSGAVSGLGDALGDSFVGIENLTGTGFADTLFGDGLANAISGGVGVDNLYGRAGDDTLLGGDGNDNLEGGLGGDVLDGGAGFDLAYYSQATAAVIVDLANTALNTGEASGDSYVSIDGLVGTGFDDQFYGDALNNLLIGQNGNDILEGRGGSDTLYGGAGTDEARFAGVMATHSIVVASGRVTVRDNDSVADGDTGLDTLYDIETLRFKNDETVNLAAPIVFDLDNNGIDTIGLSHSNVWFDMNGDGQEDRTSWFGPNDGVLVLDRNGDGMVSDAGEFSFIDDLPGAQSDLEGLAFFDSNADGEFSALDAQWEAFSIWVDSNSNGVSEAGELRALSSLGVQSIALSSQQHSGEFAVGDTIITAMGSYQRTDGSQGALADALFAYTDAQSQAAPLQVAQIIEGDADLLAIDGQHVTAPIWTNGFEF